MYMPVRVARVILMSFDFIVIKTEVKILATTQIVVNKDICSSKKIELYANPNSVNIQGKKNLANPIRSHPIEKIQIMDM